MALSSHRTRFARPLGGSKKDFRHSPRAKPRIGMQQTNVILPGAGADYVGPLPAAVGVLAVSQQPEAAQALVSSRAVCLDVCILNLRQIAKETVMSAQTRKLVHPDIKPENPPERAAHYLDVPNMPWETTKFPGIKIKVLYTDDSGITTALFKLDPGAVVPLHEHTALEQTYVIEGSLEDHEGRCGPGQFVWRPAGNQHEAFAPDGAMLLGFFLKPNRFAYGERFFTAPGER
jgi:anti-sigma factor ChrR (cupin superfamily)